jgi:hypothetical protein
MIERRLSKLLASMMLAAVLVACNLVADPTPQPGPAAETTALPAATPMATLVPLPPRPLADFVDQAPLQLVQLAADGQTIHVQQPAYLAVEWAAPYETTAAYYVSQDDGQGQRLIRQRPLLGPAGSIQADPFPAGAHRGYAVWPAEDPYLTDQLQGDYVLLVPATAGEVTGEGLVIAGRYRPAAAAEYIDVELAADTRDWQVGPLRETAGGAVIQPAAGDEFQLLNHYLDGQWRPGLSLFFEAEGQLTFQQLLLPDGGYQLGITVQDPAGRSQAVTTDVVVDNSALRIAHRAYLDPYWGYQFHYPAGWPVPAYQAGRLTAGDVEGQTRLTVSHFPDPAARTAGQLQEAALAQLGPVQPLFRDEIALAGSGSLWLAYGYEGPDGPRTGVLLTFVHGGTGYAVDIDGPASSENETLALVRVLAESWAFRPVTFGQTPGHWLSAGNGEFQLTVPVDYYQTELGNGWWRYSGGDGVTFLAVRTDPDRGPAESAAHWAGVAGRDMAGFRASRPYEATATGRDGWQVDFAYEGEDGPVWGVIWVAGDGEGNLVFWAETAADGYESFVGQLLLIALTTLEPA